MSLFWRQARAAVRPPWGGAVSGVGCDLGIGADFGVGFGFGFGFGAGRARRDCPAGFLDGLSRGGGPGGGTGRWVPRSRGQQMPKDITAPDSPRQPGPAGPPGILHKQCTGWTESALES